jgi:hypothetical protein
MHEIANLVLPVRNDLRALQGASDEDASAVGLEYFANSADALPHGYLDLSTEFAHACGLENEIVYLLKREVDSVSASAVVADSLIAGASHESNAWLSNCASTSYVTTITDALSMARGDVRAGRGIGRDTWIRRLHTVVAAVDALLEFLGDCRNKGCSTV